MSHDESERTHVTRWTGNRPMAEMELVKYFPKHISEEERLGFVEIPPCRTVLRILFADGWGFETEISNLVSITPPQLESEEKSSPTP